MTDMTLLMYACKSGASGVGDPKAAARVSFDTLCTSKVNKSDTTQLSVLDCKEVDSRRSKSGQQMQMDRHDSPALRNLL